MIRATDRIAAVLARDERLLEVLATASPAFEKLRNPALRKTMARLVTVEQAARIAGIDAGALVARLNAALDGDAPTTPPPAPRAEATIQSSEPVPAWLMALPPEHLVDLDVREDLRAGREPFRRIMQSVELLPPGGVLRLRAPFEPVPLYDVLARRGLDHVTERLAPDDYRVWFHRAESSTTRAPDVLDGAPDAPEGDDVVFLDVRGLEPPEPMVRTLEALEALPRGKTLVQLNVRVPQFLLPKLEERGFAFEVHERSPGLVHLLIRHR